MTSQKKDKKRAQDKQAKHQKYREAIKPLRKNVMTELRELVGKGYSRRQVAQSIIPSAGKKSKNYIRERLRAMMLKQKREKKKKE